MAAERRSTALLRLPNSGWAARRCMQPRSRPAAVGQLRPAGWLAGWLGHCGSTCTAHVCTHVLERVRADSLLGVGSGSRQLLHSVPGGGAAQAEGAVE